MHKRAGGEQGDSFWLPTLPPPVYDCKTRGERAVNLTASSTGGPPAPPSCRGRSASRPARRDTTRTRPQRLQSLTALVHGRGFRNGQIVADVNDIGVALGDLDVLHDVLVLVLGPAARTRCCCCRPRRAPPSESPRCLSGPGNCTVAVMNWRRADGLRGSRRSPWPRRYAASGR